MKKLIAVFVLFSVIMTFAGVEIYLCRSVYSKEVQHLSVVLERMEKTPENINTQEILEAYETASLAWQKNRKKIMVFSHHSAVKTIDEKIAALGECIKYNQQCDAFVAVTTALNYLSELKNEYMPLPANLF